MVQEPVPQNVEADDAAAQGAVGGTNMRQGVVALMDVMRDLLNNIRFIPPPAENPQNDNENNPDDDDEWEDWLAGASYNKELCSSHTNNIHTTASWVELSVDVI